jgi:WD40 repeat protein
MERAPVLADEDFRRSRLQLALFAAVLLSIAASCDRPQPTTSSQEAQPNGSPSVLRLPTSKRVTAAAFSSDDKLLLVGYGFDGPVNHDLDPNLLDVWEVQGGKKLSAPGKWEARGSGQVHDVAFIPNGKLALCAGIDKALTIWDVEDRKLLQALDQDALDILCVAASADGKFAISGHGAAYGPRQLRVWDLGKRKALSRIRIGYANPSRLIISPDGKLVLIIMKFLTPGEPNSLELRAVADGALVRSFPLKDGWHGPATFTPDGKGILVTQRGDCVLFDLMTGKETRRFRARAFDVAFSLDGKRLLCLGRPSTFYDAATGDPLSWRKVNWSDLLLFCFSADGRFGFSAEAYSTVGNDIAQPPHMSLSVWDATTLKRLRTLRQD